MHRLGRARAIPGLRLILRDNVPGAAVMAVAMAMGMAANAPADVQTAAFSTYCIACHGVDGRGVEGLGADLVASTYVAGASAAELVEFLKLGRLPNDPASVSGQPMPGFAYLDDAELAALADYLKRLSDL